MPRIGIVLAVALLGAPAAAQPWAGPYGDRYGDPYRGRYEDRARSRAPYGAPYRDRRDAGYDRWRQRGAPLVRWQELLVRPTTHPDVDVVLFQGAGGRLGWLRIEPMRGLARVDIEYTNRPPQTLWLDRAARQRGLGGVFELDRGARIRQITIYSRSPYRTGYVVYGG